MPASQAMSAASKAFCSRMAASKRSRAQEGGELAPGAQALLRGVGNHAVDGAFAGVEIGHPGPGHQAMWACGKIRRMARMAGSDITASPSQLVARTHTREIDDGLKDTKFQDNSGWRVQKNIHR